MSADSQDSSPETRKISPEDLAAMLAASGMPAPAIDPPGGRRGALGKKVLIAVVVAGIGVGASIMSCVGQSFSYRQARALEGIEQHLGAIQEGCRRAP